ncbi:YHS domain-containing protein [Singulisphaera sp. GP187]|uniref:YHS domain-containing protein n=1 Tax=Singulisphaera sp. GP187 TaxID=1882752 RepID=UPI000927A001|nr:YHS domain-containing protein [Singulisphaera sp. GP187]SIN74921.1 YHS domain-containing protein [Singulisphaera sp. GP187]
MDMKRMSLLVGVVGLVFGGSWVVAADSPAREIPAPFVPFEHMIGSWKGTAVPAVNRLKGWSETHMWAWKFAKGQPVGMTLEFTGDKALAKAQLSYAADTKQYRLEGTDPEGKAIEYVGAMDKAGRALVLDRVGPPGQGKDRISIRPNTNLIRYTIDFTHQETGAPQFAKVVEVGLTKAGVSFAAGGESADLPKCILTGGAATMAVTYQGKSYPICCSGCRDEFNDDPEKYVKKAALMTQPGAGKSVAKPASKVGRDDGSFDGLDEEVKPKAKAKGKSSEKASSSADKDKPDDEPAPSKPAAKASTKAASQLRLAQNLEKSGKTAAALQYYRDLVKDYAGTPEAKTAATRIKALAGD